MTVEQIKEQIAGLSQHDRADVALFAIRSLEPEEDVDEQAIEAAWEAELNRRAAAVRDGKSVEVPAEEVHARLREKLQRMRQS